MVGHVVERRQPCEFSYLLKILIAKFYKLRSFQFFKDLKSVQFFNRCFDEQHIVKVLSELYKLRSFHFCKNFKRA